jgi:hypothetical protein
MQEHGTKIYCMAKENTNGETEDIIRGSGWTIKCMAEGFIYGKTVGSIKEVI